MMKKKFKIKNIKLGCNNFSNYPQYGILCIKSLSFGILTNNQLESLRSSVSRIIKKKGIIWFRVHCSYPVTKKSVGSRMGKGVGPIKHYISHLKKGMVILELQTLVSKELISCLKKLVFRLPIKVCILARSYY